MDMKDNLSIQLRTKVKEYNSLKIMENKLSGDKS